MIKLRTCVNCRKKFSKEELIRIVEVNKNSVIDYNQKLDGRGLYICKDKNCILQLKEKIRKNKIKLKQNINQIDKLLDVLLEGMEK